MAGESLIEKLKRVFGYVKVYEKDIHFNILSISMKNKMNFHPLSYNLNINELENINISTDELSSEELKIIKEEFENQNIKVLSEVYHTENTPVEIKEILEDFNVVFKDIEFQIKDIDWRRIEISKLKSFGKALEVKRVNVSYEKAKVKEHMLSFYTKTKENTHFSKKLPIKRKTFPLYELSKDKQLSMWKAVIEKSKKSAKEIKIIGYFPEVPISILKNVKVNPVKKEIEFEIKDIKNPNIKKSGTVFFIYKENDKIDTVLWN